jgi:hypothetical protein
LIAVKDWAKPPSDHIDPYHLGIRFVGFITAEFFVEIDLFLLRFLCCTIEIVLRIVTRFSVLLREKSAFARADRWQASTSWWFLVRVHALHARADRESSKHHRDPIDKRSLFLFLARTDRG